MPSPPPSTVNSDAPRGVWQRFVAAHLHDYPPLARAMWLALALAGLAAGAWAVQGLPWNLDRGRWVVLGWLLVALTAYFPIRMPRSQDTFLAADVFIFALLDTLGGPVAVLAAGLEGLIGSLRSSKRLTSWVSAPASAMLAMSVAAAVHDRLEAWMHGLGWSIAGEELTSLTLAGVVYLLCATGPLMNLMALKRGTWLRPGQWLDAVAQMAVMNLGSALLAGVLVLNAYEFGAPVLAVAATVAVGMVFLLRRSLGKQERERLAQEAAVAQAQREAATSQQRFMAAFTHAAIGMAVTGPQGTLLQANQAFLDLLEVQPDALPSMAFVDILHPDDVGLFMRQEQAHSALPDGGLLQELRCRTRSGRDLWVAIHSSRYDDHDGAGHCRIYQLHDITSRHLAESRLQHIAFHDSLTDLANRHCFKETLTLAIEHTQADPAWRYAVLFLDLDRFKIINDSLGHLAGNTLLREVADRLRATVRPGDLVARLGGDEFAVLLRGLDGQTEGVDLAWAILHQLNKPLHINGTEVIPAASVGLTFSDMAYNDLEDVLRDADVAMYEAKGEGRNRVVVFNRAMHDRMAERLALETDLRRAIGEGQLTLHFQPLFDLDPHHLSGFEALARWHHPQRGPISPAVFIQLAEESGHIEALTDWVIEQSVRQLARWQADIPGTAKLIMHVNISGRDLGRADLVGSVQSVLCRHAVRPERLTLEITETTLMGRLDTALQTMAGLRATGVHFSIDDFGTGYSSLAYLGTLPIDSLKIDRSFVMGLHDKPQNIEIVRAVLTLGHALGRKVVAEGIETPEQLATLRSLGVDIGQGYLLSRPLRSDQATDLLAVTFDAHADLAARHEAPTGRVSANPSTMQDLPRWKDTP